MGFWHRSEDWQRDQARRAREDERFGRGRGERPQEGRFTEGINQEGRWGGGSYYGDPDSHYGRADYEVGRGRSRELMDDRHRSDRPGMEPRGDYGMDDYRRREGLRGVASRDEDRTRGEHGRELGGRVDERGLSGHGYGSYGPGPTHGGYTTLKPDAPMRYGGAGSVGAEGVVNYGRDERDSYGTEWSQRRFQSTTGEEWDYREPRIGRGPRGYQRSDDRIREDVCDRLMMSWMNAEDVEVSVRDGEVTLQGEVDSRHEKRAIEDLSESILGVREVHNQLRVRGGLKRMLGMETTRTTSNVGTVAAGTSTDLKPGGRPTEVTGDGGQGARTTPSTPSTTHRS